MTAKAKQSLAEAYGGVVEAGKIYFLSGKALDAWLAALASLGELPEDFSHVG